MKKIISEARYKEILKEISEDTQCNHGYCFFKTMLEAMHLDPRLLMQFKAIDKFKYERSEKEKKDISMNEIGIIWVEEGYAEAFSLFYDPDKKFLQIYRETINHIKDFKK
jgi:hypothetical protein